MSKKAREKEEQRRMQALERARRQAQKKATKAKKGPQENIFKRLSNFLKDVRRELKKVSWPARKETVSSTWVVLTVVFLFGFYFYVVDVIVGTLIRWMLTVGS